MISNSIHDPLIVCASVLTSVSQCCMAARCLKRAPPHAPLEKGELCAIFSFLIPKYSPIFIEN